MLHLILGICGLLWIAFALLLVGVIKELFRGAITDAGKILFGGDRGI